MKRYAALDQGGEEDGQYSELEEQSETHSDCSRRMIRVVGPWIWLIHIILLTFSVSILAVGISKNQETSGCLETTSAWCKFPSLRGSREIVADA